MTNKELRSFKPQKFQLIIPDYRLLIAPKSPKRGLDN